MLYFYVVMPAKGELRTVYDQIREIADANKGVIILSPDWGRPTKRQEEALKKGGGSVPHVIQKPTDGGARVQ